MFLLIVIYAIIHTPNGDHAAKYEGMTQETITSLVQAQGDTVEFVTEQKYRAFISSRIAKLKLKN